KGSSRQQCGRTLASVSRCQSRRSLFQTSPASSTSSGATSSWKLRGFTSERTRSKSRTWIGQASTLGLLETLFPLGNLDHFVNVAAGPGRAFSIRPALGIELVGQLDHAGQRLGLLRGSPKGFRDRQ